MINITSVQCCHEERYISQRHYAPIRLLLKWTQPTIWFHMIVIYLNLVFMKKWQLDYCWKADDTVGDRISLRRGLVYVLTGLVSPGLRGAGRRAVLEAKNRHKTLLSSADCISDNQNKTRALSREGKLCIKSHLAYIFQLGTV